jgi:FkbM family methyltransferase
MASATLARARGFVLDRVLRRPVLYTDRHGLKYELKPGENARVYFEHSGNYEVAETRFCEQLLRPGDVVIDGGANIGLYSMLFGRLVGESGRVVAFEPDPVNAGRLRSNLQLNGLSFVAVEEQALWSEPARVALNRFEPAFGPWHSLGTPALEHPFRKGEIARPVDHVDVAATTLDAYCDDARIGHIRLLKLDLEGAEPDALAGAARLLDRKAIDTILFEVSLPQLSALRHGSDDAIRMLREHDYRTYEITGTGLLGRAAEGSVSRYANYVALPTGSPLAPDR